ncbi:hypothetical protein [Flavihumibacter petaseus]|uniref:hypothetical protein n=1 Tax=Flavihumibacter petaseus TaxID=549295 RepID=UPI00061D37E3|nr:hypothetical protein [Flavihumibacter petaseus]
MNLLTKASISFLFFLFCVAFHLFSDHLIFFTIPGSIPIIVRSFIILSLLIGGTILSFEVLREVLDENGYTRSFRANICILLSSPIVLWWVFLIVWSVYFTATHQEATRPKVQMAHLESNETDATFVQLSQDFVKAICTKDTVAFFKLVNRDSLTTLMNDYNDSDKKLPTEDIYFPFFFVYSPPKVTRENLLEIRSKPDFYSDFRIVGKEIFHDGSVLLLVTWKLNEKNAEEDGIELLLVNINNEWKIIRGHWDPERSPA